VDELGSTNDAIAAAAEMASLEEYSILRIPERKSFLDQILDEMASPSASATLAEELPASLHGPLSSLAQLEQVLGAGGPVVMLPGTLTIQ
jgi:protease-4